MPGKSSLNACGKAKGVLWLIVAVYFETYGCQMNVNDMQIAWSILQKKDYQRTMCVYLQADVVLLVTCSVREKAEQTIWNRLQQLTAMKKKRLKTHTPMKIGLLGE
uniref:MTTase N-terminal domain-containing protein n=1 Tax=Oreochromis niloticus TaxID=8128 RepID=A0A669BUW4_ORENI